MFVHRLAFLACLAVPALLADTVAFTAPTGLSDNSGGSVNLGMVFTPNTNITIDALGFYVVPSITSSTVGMYDGTGTLLTSVTVPLTGTISGGYVFESITPITLTAGNQYTVDQYTPSGFWAYGGVPTTATSITYDFHDYVYTNSLAFPTNTGGAAGDAYYGPNLMISSGVSATPEPAPLALLSVFLSGVFLRRKFQSRPTKIFPFL